MEPKDAIKLDIVELDKSEASPEEELKMFTGDT